MSVKEVAFAVGYQDPNYFSKSFKRITGMLPTEFRED
jgi:two-component system response regulator YesN